MSTRIVIEAISPEQARLSVYAAPYSGDWYWSADGTLMVQVVASDVWDEEDAFLVALHELIEARLCFKAGIVQGAVDAFDLAFIGEDEPGDDPAAPYVKQHRQAMLIEHTMALFFGRYDYGRVE